MGVCGRMCVCMCVGLYAIYEGQADGNVCPYNIIAVV